MRYTIFKDEVALGVADLPTGTLVAARLEPLPGYACVRQTVRESTEALLHVGLFGAAEPMLPPFVAVVRRRRRTMARAARLNLELVGVRGERVATTFVNLLEAPADGGIVVIANFAEAPAAIGAFPLDPTTAGRGAA